MKTPLILIMLSAASLMSGAAETSPAAKPNLVFVLSDDLAQGDMGCYGHFPLCDSKPGAAKANVKSAKTDQPPPKP